jgi:hypothetical protein
LRTLTSVMKDSKNMSIGSGFPEPQNTAMGNQIVNADHVRFDCFGFFFFNLHRVHLKPSLFLNFYFESKDVF